MAKMNFGGVEENVVTRAEMPLERAREILKGKTIAVLGYGVQGPGQSLNLKDNGFNVIVGQRPGKTYDKAVADGWVPGETLFGIEEAAKRGDIVLCLLSDAAVMSVWPVLKPCLTTGKTLYFSHGFAITWADRTGCVPPADIDVIMVAPKGSGATVRSLYLEGRGINSSFAVYQDYTGKALETTIALGIGIGSGYMFETTFEREAVSDLRACSSPSTKFCARTATLLPKPSTRLSRSLPSRSCPCSRQREWTGCTPTVPLPHSAEPSTGWVPSTMP